MTALRLAHALETGALALPEGRIAVFAPRVGDMLPFGPDVAQVITGGKPERDYFAERGYDCQRVPSGAFAAALVLVPRSRERARGLIATAAALGCPVLVEGNRTDGIDGLLRDLKSRVAGLENVSKAHGRVIWFDAGADLADWAKAALPRQVGPWWTVPGAFSADGPDPGSEALLAALPQLKGRVADLGAGWGFLAAGVLAASPAVRELHLIEADADALDCARRNLSDPRASFHWADALRPLPGAPFDVVVSNPPFHTTRAADPGLGRAFLEAAARSLTPQGTLWLVANRHLPYESALSEAFIGVETLPGTPAFKIIRASRPKRRR
ncbi:class I SAM-dependent methyltransferase [Frigidibacter sp. ROC022]|uniref:class I SAM-dependent methyltransferase n=1 Tax=Frigidibacter sp. ROC022 TaxID=2971796 RepID=UPI00215AA9C0|nr:methyltransferase [Frigidibacter sp. ROC022]MCR8725945.1 methyltransferase [Frigidibacter sp. ROC022]